MSFLKEQWKKYAARKSNTGIVFDFILLALLLSMIHPTSRMAVRSFVVKLTMSTPKELDEEKQMVESDYNWKYSTLDGKERSFDSLKGKVIFLNFWATWCPPCVAEFPAIEDLYTQFGDKVEFVLISNEQRNVLEQFKQKKQFSSPVYIQADSYPDILLHSSFPTTFIISKKGKIVMEKKGAAKWNSEGVVNTIKKLIEE